METWAIGIAFSTITGLGIYIWKTSDTKIEKNAADIRAADGRIDALHQVNATSIERCAQNHKNDIRELDIQRMLKETLKEFKADFKDELINCIKLTLMEEGYINSPLAKGAKRKKPNEA